MYCYFKILLLLSPGYVKKNIVLIEDNLALGESIFDLLTISNFNVMWLKMAMMLCFI
jgi:hypothetical protein